MDSLKTLDFELFNRPAKNQFQGESGNKDLWLRALEKNSLYSSLEKFEVIEGQQRFEVADNKHNVAQQAKRENNAEKYSAIEENNISVNSGVLENGVVNLNKGVSFNSRSVVKNSALNQAATNYQHVFNLFSVGNNKGVRLAGLYKGHEMKMPWLTKNTTVTMANSGIEVWVRDANMTGNKLSDVLKHLQHSMADLGASLAKVTVNGNVVFYQKDHHSSMEG